MNIRIGQNAVSGAVVGAIIGMSVGAVVAQVIEQPGTAYDTLLKCEKWSASLSAACGFIIGIIADSLQ